MKHLFIIIALTVACVTNLKAQTDSIFPLNEKPEDIIANLYNCTSNQYFDVETGEEADGTIIYKSLKHCIWKPMIKDFKKLYGSEAQNFASDISKLATRVHSMKFFKQNGISNLIIITASLEINEEGNLSACHSCGALMGIIRFHVNENDKTKKLISNDKILLSSGAWGMPGNIDIFQIDDENIFYENTDSYSMSGNSSTMSNYYDLNGNLLFFFEKEFSSAGADLENYSTLETKMEVDKTNKLIKLISKEKIYKNEKLKSTKTKTETYKYDKGNITKIKTPVAPKPAVKKPAAKTSAVKKPIKKN